jgi:hypothetical protein
MIYVTIFDAKEGTTLDDINREREEWIRKGRDKVFEKMCGSLKRYEVAGMTPMRIVFVIETDDLSALNVISRHFGNHWDSVTYPVMERGIYEALEEDKTITCG